MGDTTDPGFYICGASGFLFCRIRIQAPTIASYNEINGSIFVLIESDGDLSTVDYAFTWDAKSSDQSKHGLEMQVKDLVGPSWSSIQMKDVDGSVANKIAPPDFNTSLVSPDGGMRTVDSQPTTHFGTTSFVDIAVSCDYLLNRSGTALRCEQPLRYQLGSIDNATDHNALCGNGGDIAGGQGCTDLVSNGWPQPTASGLFAHLEAFRLRRGEEITVRWRTERETEVASYEVEWAPERVGPFEPAADSPVTARGTGGEYCVTFPMDFPGRSFIRVRATLYDGSQEISPSVRVRSLSRRSFRSCG